MEQEQRGGRGTETFACPPEETTSDALVWVLPDLLGAAAAAIVAACAVLTHVALADGAISTGKKAAYVKTDSAADVRSFFKLSPRKT